MHYLTWHPSENTRHPRLVSLITSEGSGEKVSSSACLHPKHLSPAAAGSTSGKGRKGPKYLDAIVYAPRVLADRPSVLITEEGNVITMEFPNLVISIRQKPGK